MDMKELQQAAAEFIKSIEISDALPLSCLPTSIVPRGSCPDLEHLSKLISPIDHEQYSATIHSKILVLEVCLNALEDLPKDSPSIAILTTIREWIAQALLPPRQFAFRSSFDAHPTPELNPSIIRRFQLLAAAGLRLLMHLYTTTLSHPPLSLLTSLVIYSDINAPWTHPSSLLIAQQLVELYLGGPAYDRRRKEAVTDLLRGVVKPLFAKSKSAKVTEAGRKVMVLMPGTVGSSGEEVDLKRWKFGEVWVIGVARWCMDALDETMLEENWPLLIPPLLALVDDESTDVKTQGCELLQTFLKITSPSLLQRTGLGEVFEDALMPCLSYLPTLTPEAESLNLLGNIYPTLIQLVKVRYPEDVASAQRIRSLDKMLRTGVLKGHAHAGEYVNIGEFLIVKMGDLVDEMGVMAVKHLRDIIPLLSSTMTGLLAKLHLPLLLASAKTLQKVILNCWPRISRYRGEIFKAMLLCWCRIKEEDLSSADVAEIASALQKNTKLMKATLQQDSEAVSEVEDLLGSDLIFKPLLSIWQSTLPSSVR